MANTVIQLKYSNVTGTPPSLNLAEPAYSNVSNKLWIDDGTGVVAIGGKHYTGLIDAGTQLATQNTFVRRDTSGNFAANTITINTLNANTSVIQNGYNLYDFANAAFTQANTALITGGQIAGGYANSAYIHANAAYGQANTGTTLAQAAFDVANTATSGTAIDGWARNTANAASSYANSAFDKANTAFDNAAAASSYANSAYALANTSIQETGGTITGDLSITGNLIISGNTVTQDVATLNIADPLIYLAANNYVSDIVDIGFAGNYYDGSNQRHAGFIRKHGTDNFYLFTNYEHEPDNNIIDVNDASFRTATLYSNVRATSVLIRNIDPLDHANAAFASANTADQRAVTSGSYANSAYTQANTATQYAQSAGVYANAAFGAANTADQRAVTSGSYANSAFAAANTADQRAVTSGSYANSAYGQANTATTLAQAAFDVANTDVTNVSTSAGTYGSASVVPSFRVEANGRISSISTNNIAIDAGAITTGTLGVSRGGTGNTSFTANHVILGSGTSALTTVGSSTEGHILTINSSGVPTFQHLNGGTF